MPEEETLTELPKKKEKEEIFRKIEIKHIVALAVIGLIGFWMYSSSTPFRELIQKNMVWLLIIGVALAYWLTQKGKGPLPIGMIQAESLARQWIEYKQRKREIPEGQFSIIQSKRKAVDENPKDYYLDIRIQTDQKPNSFLVSVDSQTGDVKLSEPAVITRLSEEPEAKDVFLKKRVVTGEVEVEEV